MEGDQFPQVDTQTFAGVTYTFSGLTDYSTAYTDFQHRTNNARAPLKKIAETKKIENNDLKIDEPKNYKL